MTNVSITAKLTRDKLKKYKYTINLQDFIFNSINVYLRVQNID